MAIELSISIVAITFISVEVLGLIGEALSFLGSWFMPLGIFIRILTRIGNLALGISILTTSIGISIPLT